VRKRYLGARAASVRWLPCRIGPRGAGLVADVECASTLRRLFSRTELKVDASDRDDVRGVGLGGGGYAWLLFLA